MPASWASVNLPERRPRCSCRWRCPAIMLWVNLFTMSCTLGDIGVSPCGSKLARGGGVVGGEGNCSLCSMTGEKASKVISRISSGLTTIDKGNILVKYQKAVSSIHVSGTRVTRGADWKLPMHKMFTYGTLLWSRATSTVCP